MKIRKLKKWQIVFISIFLLIVIGLGIASTIVKKYIVNNSKVLIGRQVTIDKLRLNYFTGVLTIGGFTMFEDDSVTPFISFQELYVNVDYWPLVNNEFRISKIALVDLYAQVIQNESEFNFSSLIPADTLSTEEPIDSLPKESMLINIEDISLTHSHLQFTDKLLDHTITISDINLNIPGFSFNGGNTDLKVDFAFEGGGKLFSLLELNQVDSTYTIGLRLDSLNLDIVEPYLKEYLYISDLSGYFSNDIQISGNMNHIMNIQMNGNTTIDEFELKDIMNNSVVSFKTFLIDLDTLQLDERIIKLNKILLDRPRMVFELIDSTNNLSAMIIPTESIQRVASDTTIQSGDSISYQIALENIALNDGEVIFKDSTIRYPFTTLLHNINIQSKNITSSSQYIDVDFSAEMDHTALFNSNISFNPSDLSDMNLIFDLNKFAMKIVEPYFKHYVGYPVEQGLMSYSSKNMLKKNYMTSDNSIEVRGLKLGQPDKKNAEYKLPIRLALGILSDKDGLIDLDLPVKSKGNDVSIDNLGKLIFKTLGDLILKAATSPVSFISNMYDVDPDKLRFVNYELYGNTPDKKQIEKLDIISNILINKPALKLKLDHYINKDLFIDSLAYIITVERWRDEQKNSELIQLKSVPDSLILNFVADNDSSIGNIKQLCVSYIGEDVLTTKFDSICIQQGDFIYDYMVAHKGIKVDQLNIFKMPTDSVPHDLKESIFKVEFEANNK